MKLLLKLTFLLSLITLISCNKDDASEEYIPVPVTPVIMDLTQVPYPKLSDYKFFDGEMKNQKPVFGVIPYRPESELFTDYAEKKRFIWVPTGLKASYVNDYSALELPVGGALIKNFYYNNVQPSNTTKIIESRIMIRKSNGWIYANYVWNDEQTEAFLDLNGSTEQITWIDNNSVSRTITYDIPNETKCVGCHTISNEKRPLGIKPQNLNGNYNYADGVYNQLAKWKSLGILENNTPNNINAVVNYKDTSKPLETRVRSYFDSNCAHCHQPGGYADYFDLKLEFKETTDQRNMGVCVTPNHIIPGINGRIVKLGDPSQSTLYYRLTTNDPNYRMPFLGRSVIHTEGAALIEQWILSLTDCPN
jgi:uncharacterized repeat protein (TIGR03806 family)